MHIDSVLLYAATYLGGPFGVIIANTLQFLQLFDAEGGLLAAQIMGSFGLLISVGLGFLVIVQWRGETCRAEAILLTIIFMVVGTAIVTALGRLNFTYTQALSSRYTTPALIFWSATGLLGYLIAARLPSSIGRALSIVGVTVLSILSTIVVLHQMFVICGPPDIRLVRDEAGIAIILGVKDDEALKHIFPNPSIPWQARDFLRQKRLSMFSEPFVEWYGLNIRDKFHLAPKSRCQGVIDSFDVIVSSGSGTLRTHGRVKGWAWDRESASVAQIIVIADERDVIVGLGLSGHWRPDVSKTLPTIKSARVGWQGYVNAVAGNSLTAYAVTDDGQTICQLDQEHVAPQPMIDINEVIQMSKIVSKNIRLNGMWQLDGDDHINVIRPDPNDKVYGSWNGSDANVGNLVLDGLSVPVSRRIVIPVVTGPSSSSLSIAVLDSSGRELMRIQPESPMKWAALVIKVPLDAGATIDLSVDDNGPGWGQWMAIGTPRAVPDL
ncbi:hypothetical protein SAE02_25460 [Skermanella aerolata]|uniref:Uncharacterized protein n=2 Tax=Skermanella aerolata TaxID=393310 RepID=A0A512DPK1_9PROT|nr:hypothetical protein N826_39470 [Skermanella aerolata KACC 11604]GEO38398.1 hypothetical protein SAE02_25460 [Skermanella aerolata]